METNTADPQEAYKYWMGSNPNSDVEVIEGQYWQSAHWTREYVLYLKLKPTEDWWDEFIEQNQLQVDHEDWNKPEDVPFWFRPSENSIMGL